MICPFCQQTHDNEGDRYGCPYCHGEGLDNMKDTKRQGAKRTAETWRLAQGVSYYYQELLRRPGDARIREQYEWLRDRYAEALEKEKEEAPCRQ